MRAFAPFLLCLALATGHGQTASGQEMPLASLQQAAEAGDVAAQVMLGERLRLGDGMPQNFAGAATWYRRAGEQGDAVALNRLGRLVFAGLGQPRDHAAALSLLAAAAERGAPELVFDLANALENAEDELADPARAAQLYEQAADLGLQEAAVNLAVLLIEGKGVASDPARALNLLEPIAERGHPKAANNLGLLYVRGQGVEQDYERAAGYFRIAAQSGLPEALRNLGVLHENGFGVEQTDAGAAALYRQAASLVAPDPAKLFSPVLDPRLIAPPSEPEAIARLLSQAESGEPVALALAGSALLASGTGHENMREAINWLRRAAHSGHGYSMANLGILYVQGRGVLQDYVFGYAWLSLAQAAGMEGADQLLDLLLPTLTPAQVAEAQEVSQELWQKIAPAGRPGGSGITLSAQQEFAPF